VVDFERLQLRHEQRAVGEAIEARAQHEVPIDTPAHRLGKALLENAVRVWPPHPGGWGLSREPFASRSPRKYCIILL
jgi:hypothetical protein